jgi:glycosyltransferase involved in cell wall biosynthesis
VKPLRVAMIGTRGVPATYGGVERAVEELAARLASRGHRVTVYCRTSYGASRPDSYRGVRLRYLPAVDTKHLEAISHTFLATLDAIVRRYDVVHFHAIGPTLCAPLARLARLRVVSTVHSLDFRGGKWGRVARLVLRLGARCAARMPHRTIVVSRQLQSYFADRYTAHTTYVPNGVELVRGDGVASVHDRLDHGHLLFLGRLVPEKGVHTLIEAYRSLDTTLPLVIAGPSSHSAGYERTLHELARGDPRIRLVGAVYDGAKTELVRLAYVFCQPSTHEGLPIALLEMMGEGICPVVSDIPEHLEVVSTECDGSAAIVFDAGDPDSLREALELVLGDPDLVRERGQAARAVVADRYSWDDTVAQIEAVYGEATERAVPLPGSRRAS